MRAVLRLARWPCTPGGDIVGVGPAAEGAIIYGGMARPAAETVHGILKASW